MERYAWLMQGVPDGVVITQFHHTQWQSHNTLPTTASVLKLMDNLIKTQMGTGNHAITVLCRYKNNKYFTQYYLSQNVVMALAGLGHSFVSTLSWKD